MFKPVTTVRNFEAISAQIREQIEARRLRPGDKLPAERELAVQFGVSRNAVREALRSLESAGIIGLQKGAHGGAFVLEGNFDGVTRSIRDMLALGRISLDNLTEARQEIMKVVLQMASERATEDDIQKLEENVALSEKAIAARQHETQMALSAEFYSLLAQATQNVVLVLLVDPLSEVVRHFVNAAGIRATEPVVDSRKELVACLRNHDGEGAIRIMNDHLTVVHQAILRKYPEGSIATISK
jgi:DNA-binding FadR family transcriptional regulator